MEAVFILEAVLLGHVICFFLDRYLKVIDVLVIGNCTSKMTTIKLNFDQGIHSPKYAIFLKILPVQIEFLNVKWATSVFNKTLNSWVVQKLWFLHKWYNLGTVVTLLICIPSMILLTSTALTSFQNLFQTIQEETALQPVLPGINLPKSDYCYYFITLLLCTVVHEVGHAIAALW